MSMEAQDLVAAVLDAPEVAPATLLDEARGPAAPRAEVVGAVVSGARAAAEARAFLAFVGSPEGQTILGAFGFGPP